MFVMPSAILVYNVMPYAMVTLIRTLWSQCHVAQYGDISVPLARLTGLAKEFMLQNIESGAAGCYLERVRINNVRPKCTRGSRRPGMGSQTNRGVANTISGRGGFLGIFENAVVGQGAHVGGRFRNLDYCGQDTNAAIEGYHGFAKSILKSERSRMTGRRVDWCITALTEDVLDHYWYMDLRKQMGFVDNKKMQDSIVNSILKARSIPDDDVTLPLKDVDVALVTSVEHRHLRYTVHNLGSEWGVCNCVWAQRGNMCKHHVKVVMMMHPEMVEGTIARFCGRLAGNVNGGLQQLLTPRRVEPAPASQAPTPMSLPRATPTRHAQPDLAETLRQQIILLHEEVEGDQVMMQHLVADLNQTLGRLKTLKAEMNSGTVHPMATSPHFSPVNDGKGYKLGRYKDFLERPKSTVARRL